MEEFKFVIKCFLFACLIVIFSQTKVQNVTLENKASIFLQHSELAQLIRASADGGVKLILQGYEKTIEFFDEKLGRTSLSKGRPIYSARTEKAQQGGAAEPLGGQSYKNPAKQSSSQDETYFEEDRF
jgi:hypothetical protein